MKKFFCPVFHVVFKNFRKIPNFSNIQKCPKSFPILTKLALNMFWGIFSEKKSFAQCSMDGRAFENFRKKPKKFQNSKSAKNRSHKSPNVFWTCFGPIFRNFFAQCSKQGFSDFLDLKTWVQFYETILNRHSFCIHATVNIRNPISDFLDLRLWIQIPELKNMCSVFWTKTIWNRFSGLKIRGRYLEKIQEKNQEGFKVLKLSKIVLKCPNLFWSIFLRKSFFPQCSMEGRVFEKFQKSKKAQNRSQKYSNVFWTCFGPIFLKKFFCPVFHGVFENIRKIPNFSKIQKCLKSFPILSKLALNMFWGNFSKKQFRPVFHGWPSLRKFSKQSKNIKIQKLLLIVSKSVQTCFEHALGRFFRFFLPSNPCRAFQIFWT